MTKAEITARMEKLVIKAKSWGEKWDVSMMEYSPEYNQITVWVGRADIYKAFFDADTLACLGTKC